MMISRTETQMKLAALNHCLGYITCQNDCMSSSCVGNGCQMNYGSSAQITSSRNFNLLYNSRSLFGVYDWWITANLFRKSAKKGIRASE